MFSSPLFFVIVQEGEENGEESRWERRNKGKEMLF